jgi:hypothetical protein
MQHVALGYENKLVRVEHGTGELGQAGVLNELRTLLQFRFGGIPLETKIPCQTDSIGIIFGFFC